MTRANRLRGRSITRGGSSLKKEQTIKFGWTFFPKQREAWRALYDNTTEEIVYGGGAGGGKTRLGCRWLAKQAFKYPGSRWLLGRKTLKSLKQSTLLSLFAELNESGLVAKKHYRYNPIDGEVHFANGSIVFLKQLKIEPSDPELEDLGSTEFTGAFIDEAGQIDEKAKNIVKSRLRFGLNEFNLIPKLLMSCNPTKNFLYRNFYMKEKEGKLASHLAFIQSLPTDNPFLPKPYLETLKRLDPITVARLFYGDWEFDDDPSRLMDYEAIVDIFTNTSPDSEQRYIAVDAARLGKDKAIIGIWRGLKCFRTISIARCTVPELANRVKVEAEKWKVPYRHIVVDEGGVGGGVVDLIPNCRAFLSSNTQIAQEGNPTKFTNLRTQAYYKLAEFVNNSTLGVLAIMPEVEQAITEELEQIKRINDGKDGPIKIVDKDMIKKKIGRSPDYADMLSMRMIFELDKPDSGNINFAVG